MIQGPPGNDGSTGEPGAPGKEVRASYITRRNVLPNVFMLTLNTQE